MVGKGAAASKEQVPGKVDHCPSESRPEENDDVIPKEVKLAMLEVVANEMATMVEEGLDDVQRILLHVGQSGVQSVVYNIVEKAFLDFPSKDVFGETLDAYITRYFDPKGAGEGFLKRLLNARSFMAPITTFHQI